MTDSSFADGSGKPTRPMMSACEVISWIAFRRASSIDDLDALTREADADQDAIQSAIAAARAELKDRAAAGLITLYGARRTGDGMVSETPVHEPIPAELLMHPKIIVTEWDRVEPNFSGPLEDWLSVRVPEYEYVQARTAEVLAHWPVVGPALLEMPTPDPEPEIAVTLDDLPTAWTIPECVTWIMLRDPTVVRRIDGQSRNAAVSGPRETGLRLDLQRAFKSVEHPGSVGCGSSTACHELSDALEKGGMSASGVRPDGTRVVMEPASWRDLAIREGRDGSFDAEPTMPSMSGAWRGITIAKADIVARWPPEDVARSPAIKDEPQTPSTRNLPAAEAVVGTTASRVGRASGGRPPVHDWDAFWIEVAWYAAENDLEAAHRHELQRHMENWTAKTWEKPPDAETIRKKIRELFARVTQPD